MDKKEIWKRIDHTLLKAAASWEEIARLCDEAVTYGAASVCVPPSYAAPISKAYGGKVTICTVIGFPLGYQTTRTKCEEAREALESGARELDMVINLGMVKNGDFGAAGDEIAALRELSGGRVLKVIVETCYLTREEKIELCRRVTGAGADYIKTSTGFGSAGAVLEDIRLFREHIGTGVKIKAAGGISTLEDMEAFINAGCERIGTSRGVSLLERP
ncbi:MAG: deoxyribose-phosphate aldolase [Treponema sp.]|nr:deoxyribose-phosphate aldolase [Treponema sp.]